MRELCLHAGAPAYLIRPVAPARICQVDRLLYRIVVGEDKEIAHCALRLRCESSRRPLEVASEAWSRSSRRVS